MLPSPSSSSSSPASCDGEKKYKGVRKRKWGKWVSEIRLPNSRDRIWLGSYDTPEKAARAFDAAFVTLRGHGAAGADLNFPDSPPPPSCGARTSDPQLVQAAALSHANRRARATPRHAAPPPLSMATEECGFATAVRDDGSIDWRPVMAHPPPLYSPPGCWPGGSSNGAYDFLQAPPPASCADDGMDDVEESGHGASASLWSFDTRDYSYFRY
uniref:AP2/ERF domain-containing protein n=1 Tax=Leersia perrieri TaxID=77586 RepID=A0A0D9VLU4_9ORYZ